MADMPNASDDSGFVSLLDLASANTDAIAVVLSRNPAAGMYLVKCEDVKGKQGEEKEGKPGLISFNYVHEVLEAKPIDKKVDAMTLVGKKLRESYIIWPSQMEELIGELKGRHQKVGLPNQGAMGAVDGAPPGWLDTAIGHPFWIRVRTFQSKGQERVAYDWVSPAVPATGAVGGQTTT